MDEEYYDSCSDTESIVDEYDEYDVEYNNERILLEQYLFIINYWRNGAVWKYSLKKRDPTVEDWKKYVDSGNDDDIHDEYNLESFFRSF